MCVVRGWDTEELHLEENLLKIKAKMDQPRLDASYYNPCDFILDPKIAEKLDKNVEIIGILSIISSSLSIISTGSVIVFILYHRICRSPDVNSLFHLSVADFLLAIFWVIGPIIHFQYHKTGPGSVEGLQYFCATWQALCEMVHIMSFFLTINYALNVFLRMKEKKDRLFEYDDPQDSAVSRRRANVISFLKTGAYLGSWVLPIAFIIPILIEIARSDPTCQMCIILLDAPKPTSEMGKVANYNGCILMIITLLFSIITIILLYLFTLKMYRKTFLGFRTNRQRVVIQAMARRAAAYVIVFIYCWTPALVLASMRLRKNFGSCDADPKKYEPPLVKYFVVYAIQTLSAPLQGFLNTLVYGWSRKSFRDAVTRESRQLISAANTTQYGTWESPSSSFASSGEGWRS